MTTGRWRKSNVRIPVQASAVVVGVVVTLLGLAAAAACSYANAANDETDEEAIPKIMLSRDGADLTTGVDVNAGVDLNAGVEVNSATNPESPLDVNLIDGVNSTSSVNLSQLTFERLSGGTATIGEAAGQPLVVNFFASWCPPCVREMPEFQSVFEDIGSEVAFLGLSQDHDINDAIALVDRTGVTYETGWDPDLEVYEATGSFAMPTTAFVSEDGELLSVFAGALDADGLTERVNAIFELATSG